MCPISVAGWQIGTRTQKALGFGMLQAEAELKANRCVWDKPMAWCPPLKNHQYSIQATHCILLSCQVWSEQKHSQTFPPSMTHLAGA